MVVVDVVVVAVIVVAVVVAAVIVVAGNALVLKAKHSVVVQQEMA